jgi:hypothetical protein
MPRVVPKRSSSRDQATTKAQAGRAGQVAYETSEIVDAPEHYEYARAMGLLTWGTWDSEARPFEERVKDFLQAFPATAFVRFQGSMLVRTADGEYGPADRDARLRRSALADNSFGTVDETLARYGLKRPSKMPYEPAPVEVAPFRETAQRRNQRLRTLYGAVDVEPENMDAAKAAEMDRIERKLAAEQIRAARERMREDSGPPKDGDDS